MCTDEKKGTIMMRAAPALRSPQPYLLYTPGSETSKLAPHVISPVRTPSAQHACRQPQKPTTLTVSLAHTRPFRIAQVADAKTAPVLLEMAKGFMNDILRAKGGVAVSRRRSTEVQTGGASSHR